MYAQNPRKIAYSASSLEIGENNEVKSIKSGFRTVSIDSYRSVNVKAKTTSNILGKNFAYSIYLYTASAAATATPPLSTTTF
jgi:hypothetical protein